MSITVIPAKKAVTKTIVQVVQEAQPEKYMLELTREQFLFVVMCAGQLCDRHKKADPIGYRDYSFYKQEIGFTSIDVDEEVIQKLAVAAEKFFKDKPE
jgi:hypothetical protein